jgi:surface polysaccharide O-acyltransferase-like enzyme
VAGTAACRLPQIAVALIWLAAGLCLGAAPLPRSVAAASGASMGIYLVHVVFTTILPVLAAGAARRAPAFAWLQGSLAIGAVAFALSWVSVALLKRVGGKAAALAG